MQAKIDEFFDAVCDIRFKNSGGCLYFCYLFYLWLLQNDLDTSEFQIVQYAYDENDPALLRNLDYINNRNGLYPGSGYHFSWIYNGVEYDGDGIVDDDRRCGVRTELHGLNIGIANMIEDFCEKALEYGEWNCMFDRNEAIDMVRESLDIDTSHLYV